MRMAAVVRRPAHQDGAIIVLIRSSSCRADQHKQVAEESRGCGPAAPDRQPPVSRRRRRRRRRRRALPPPPSSGNPARRAPHHQKPHKS
jgi:hypothetical protein